MPGKSTKSSKKNKSSKAKKASKGSKYAKGSAAGAPLGGGQTGVADEFASVLACTQLDLPRELAGEGLTAAINERPDNVLMPGMGMGVSAAATAMATNMISAPAIAILAVKRWQLGRTLHVRFMDNPHPVVRQKIEKYAHEWEQFANIRFVFGNAANAEIRITCTLGIGSWSYLGTDALVIPPGKPTMNYGWFNQNTPDAEFSRTVLHEFGHALGAIHEHQHPGAGIPWDREAVYRYYMQTQGWSRADVDAQIFAKYSTTLLNSSAYDRQSIMHYPVPKQLTIGGFEVGWNTKLSTRDKTFIRQVYP